MQPVQKDDARSELPARAGLPAGDPAGDAGSQHAEGAAQGETRRASLARQFWRVIEAIRQGDDDAVQALVLDLSRRNRFFAPLALVVGAIGMLFDGVKLLFTNWRLTLVQLLPAMWIWVAMIDLKAHVLHGKSFHVIRGPIVIPIVLAIAVITAASFFLNAVFAFAISKQGNPEIRPAFTEARRHHRTVLSSGAVIGLMLGFSTVVVVRWGELWFAVALSIVVAIMMVCYVAIPARLIGMKSTAPRGRQVEDGGRRRFPGSGGLLAPVSPGPDRPPDARLTHSVLSGGRAPVRGSGARGRRHQRGQGRQDERQTGRRSTGRRDKIRSRLAGRRKKGR